MLGPVRVVTIAQVAANFYFILFFCVFFILCSGGHEHVLRNIFTFLSVLGPGFPPDCYFFIFFIFFYFVLPRWTDTTTRAEQAFFFSAFFFSGGHEHVLRNTRAEQVIFVSFFIIFVSFFIIFRWTRTRAAAHT